MSAGDGAAPERPLTERSAMELAATIRSGELSSREVVDAHIDLLERINPRLNAMIFERLADAREEADAADARIASASPGEQLPPLLGVPFTIKESICVEGMPNSTGCVARRDFRSAETAPTAQRLLDAGAILLGLTNTSELTLWIESENRLYGRTRNAYDPSRIAGGSSGGEGAIVGSGASPFGLGSDIGGSIRIPAFCNGVFGHKPSPGLVPLSSMFPEAGGESARLLGVGPLARRSEDLMPLLRLLAGPDGVDPLAREMELGDPGGVELEGLRVIVSQDASFRPISRELLAARDRAADALAAAGARVERVSMKSTSVRRGVEPYLATLADGGSIAEILVTEGAEPLTLRRSFRRGGDHTVALRLMAGAQRLSERLPPGRNQRLIDKGRRIAERMQETIGDGVVLHPPMPGVAPRHGRTVGRLWWAAEMAWFNLAGVPVTQVPLGLNARGLPLGVQVAAGPGRDHVTIAVAQALERALGGWVPPSGGTPAAVEARPAAVSSASLR